MWSTAKEILKSKKALIALLSAVVYAAGRFGLDLDRDELLGVVTPLWAYVLGQGIADAGKEAAKLKA